MTGRSSEHLVRMGAASRFTAERQPPPENKSHPSADRTPTNFIPRNIPANQRKRAEKIERQNVCLEALREGASIEAAIKRAGVSPSGWRQWRRDLAFRADSDLARLAGKQKTKGQIRLIDLVDHDQEFPEFTQSVRFRKLYFDHDTTSRFQAAIIDAVRGCPPGMVVIVTGPPGFAKTSTMEDLVCEDIACNPNWRGAYVHASAGEAAKSLRRIKRRMEPDGPARAYLEQFGPFVPDRLTSKPWGAREITVYHATHDEKDATYQARGIASPIQGTRLNTLLVDDVQARATLMRTGQICDTLQQDFFSRAAVGTRGMSTIIVNSRVGEWDVPSELAKRLSSSGVLHKHVNVAALDPVTGDSIDPILWPYDDLMQIKARVGEEVWTCCYMGDPKSAKVKTFPWTLLEAAKDHGRRLGETSLEYRVAGLDPNIGGGNNVITVCGYDAERFEPIFQQADRGIGRTEQILAIIDATHRAHWFTDLVIERNYFQQGLAYDERLQSWAAQRGVTIHTHTTGSNKYDDTIGVASMAGSLTQQKMTFPWADDAAHRVFQLCLEEFEAWRADIRAKFRIQDRVMSIWFAWVWWQSRLDSLGASGDDAWKFAGMPYTPTAGAGLWTPRSA